MSTWKAASREAPHSVSTPPAAAVSKRPPAPFVDVVSLAIAGDEDPGSDPYNHTGQFCQPETDEYRD